MCRDSLTSAEFDRKANSNELRVCTASLRDIQDRLSKTTIQTEAGAPSNSGVLDRFLSHTRSASSRLNVMSHVQEGEMTQEILALDDEVNTHPSQKSNSKLPTANRIIDKCSKLASIPLTGSTTLGMQTKRLHAQEMSEKPFRLRWQPLPERSPESSSPVYEIPQSSGSKMRAKDSEALNDRQAAYIDVSASGDGTSKPPPVNQRKKPSKASNDQPKSVNMTVETDDLPTGARRFKCGHCPGAYVMDLRQHIHCIYCCSRYDTLSIFYDKKGFPIPI